MTSDHKQKVICLGLGRTGVSPSHIVLTIQMVLMVIQFRKTSSLRDALEILGFGPSYHMSTIFAGDGEDFAMWRKIGDGCSLHRCRHSNSLISFDIP